MKKFDNKEKRLNLFSAARTARLAALFFIFFQSFISPYVYAMTKSTSVNVSATVLARCTVPILEKKVSPIKSLQCFSATSNQASATLDAHRSWVHDFENDTDVMLVEF